MVNKLKVNICIDNIAVEVNEMCRLRRDPIHERIA